MEEEKELQEEQEEAEESKDDGKQPLKVKDFSAKRH